MPKLSGQIAVIMERERFDYHGNLTAPAICSCGAQRSESKSLERVLLSAGILAESDRGCGAQRNSYDAVRRELVYMQISFCYVIAFFILPAQFLRNQFLIRLWLVDVEVQ
jgi:hypothetical protein